MASLIPNQDWAERRLAGNGAGRILLVNKDPGELCYYGAILQRAGYRVRATSSFADAAQHLERELFDLVFLDQGSRGFEGRIVLAKAMEIDPELKVLVLARSHDSACYLGAMQSGALDYLEGHLSAAQIVAFVETFIPRRTSVRLTSRDPAKGVRPSKKRTREPESNHVQLKMGGGYGESSKSLSCALRPRQSGNDSSDSCNMPY